MSDASLPQAAEATPETTPAKAESQVPEAVKEAATDNKPATTTAAPKKKAVKKAAKKVVAEKDPPKVAKKTPAKKTAPKKTPAKKAAKKTAAKKASKKVSKKVTKRTNLGKGAKKEVDPTSARYVARYGGKELNAAQIRMLRGLRGQRKPVDRTQLKVAGGWPENWQYGMEWSNSLWELDSKKLIRIAEEEAGEGHNRHSHIITQKGKEMLEAAEKGAKEHYKASQK